ncbi:MAG: 2Fe-2S iron-sulfur cluster-binding protein [Devosia sp.]
MTADDDAPLLYILRNDVGLKGSRFGCGDGVCGACTVIVDGHAQSSCDLPLWSVEGKSVETIESLVEAPTHPLVEAFVAEGAAQCGYCVAGILMRAKALLDGGEAVDREAIAKALDGNLCRCGAHPRMIRAIARAAGDQA